MEMAILDVIGVVVQVGMNVLHVMVRDTGLAVDVMAQEEIMKVIHAIPAVVQVVNRVSSAVEEDMMNVQTVVARAVWSVETVMAMEK